MGSAPPGDPPDCWTYEGIHSLMNRRTLIDVHSPLAMPPSATSSSFDAVDEGPGQLLSAAPLSLHVSSDGSPPPCPPHVPSDHDSKTLRTEKRAANPVSVCASETFILRVAAVTLVMPRPSQSGIVKAMAIRPR